MKIQGICIFADAIIPIRLTVNIALTKAVWILFAHRGFQIVTGKILEVGRHAFNRWRALFKLLSLLVIDDWVVIVIAVLIVVLAERVGLTPAREFRTLVVKAVWMVLIALRIVLKWIMQKALDTAVLLIAAMRRIRLVAREVIDEAMALLVGQWLGIASTLNIVLGNESEESLITQGVGSGLVFLKSALAL